MASRKFHHSSLSPALFADVIIPLAVRETYTYAIPLAFDGKVQFGVRVEVPFGKKKLYAGLVIKLHADPPNYKVRKILSVLDDAPIIDHRQLALWQWMSEYYACALGEVMHAALPSQLKLHSETVVMPGKRLDEGIFDLDDRGYMIAEAVSIQKEVSIDQIRSILEIKTVYPIIKQLLEAQIIVLKEELQETYKPRRVTAVRMGEAFLEAPSQQYAFDLVKRSDHQTRALLAMIQLQRSGTQITQDVLMQTAEVTHQVLAAMEKKDLIERFQVEVSRLNAYEGELETLKPLSAQQEQVLSELTEHIDKPVLIHGVTGSGKTRVYIELIRKTLEAGKQVLYLLPEIALTTQVVSRLKKVFGDDLLLYHSRLNESMRVEVWKSILDFPKVVLGARSSIFLPYTDLGLIVVDEEHDASYKQEDPNPRYQARDAAVLLAQIHQCPIVLGSATPSIESYHNAQQGKYQLIEMPERFGQVKLPEVVVVDLKKGSRSGYFSRELLEEIEMIKKEGMQTILFQNRRGFAPLMFCDNCGWTMVCKNCDISLTYHQYAQDMQCHLCGYHAKPPLRCPDCGNHELGLKGFGTEQIEEEMKIRFPDYRVGRMDLDTARGKKKLEKIIGAFEHGELDILIGTQMVTKGLDFDHVALVSIINADQLLYYPDFRAAERAFQLMIQVSGRAGRRKRRGRVLIQAYNTGHPVIYDVVKHDYANFFARELAERRQFWYPPFCRMIELTTRHRKVQFSEQAAAFLVDYLQRRLGDRVKGPNKPGVSRVRNRYIFQVVIKLEKKAPLIKKTKHWIDEAILYLLKQKGMSTLRVAVNVDP